MKEKTRRLLVILFLLMTIIGLSFSFFSGFSQSSKKVVYSGIKFKADAVNNIWVARINNVNAAFSSLPSETEHIEVVGAPFEVLKNKLEIDTTYDFNDTSSQSIALAQHQMLLTLAQYNIFVRSGFTSENKFNLPVIMCENATSFIPVIYFRQSNTTRITLENNCIIAEASSDAEVIKVKDRIVYGIFDVIK